MVFHKSNICFRIYLIIYFSLMSNRSAQFINTHHSHLHYFVIIKLVSTSVSNNLNQDSFHNIHLVCLPIFLFAQTFFFSVCHWMKKAIEVLLFGYFAHFFRCCCIFQFFSFHWKHFFFLTSFPHSKLGNGKSIVIEKTFFLRQICFWANIITNKKICQFISIFSIYLHLLTQNSWYYKLLNKIFPWNMESLYLLRYPEKRNFQM